MVRIGVIGAGNIGTEMVKQARSREIDVGYVVTTSGVYDISGLQDWRGRLSEYLHEIPQHRIASSNDYRSPLKESDVVCLAIPTLDDGETAFKIITELLEDNIPVISCEKGALSLHYADLLKTLEESRLGYCATVGGGTSILPYMRERVRRGFDGRIYAVVNGTLNFVFDGIANGRSVGEMTFEAKKLGYAEPGAEDSLAIINTEARSDVPMKSTILFNEFIRSLGGNRFITNPLIKTATKRINPEMLRELVRQAGNRRYIVSIRRPDSNTEDIIGGYSIEFEGWVLEGGFRPISDDPLYQRFLPRGVDNAILITDGVDEIGGVYRLSGPGAGPIPTTRAMLRDLEDMKKLGVIKS